MKKAFLFFYACLLVTQLHSQTAPSAGAQPVAKPTPVPAAPVSAVAPPTGALLSKPASYSKWEVRYSYGKEDKEETEGADEARTPVEDFPRMRRLVVTYTRPLWHAIAVDNKGGKTERWFDGVTQFTDTKEGASVVSSMANANVDFNIGDNGFPDLDWISKETYKGLQDFKGVRCLVFNDGYWTAWVSLAGRLPVESLSADGVRRVYLQLDAPGAPVKLPKSVGSLSDSLKKDIEKIKRPPSRFQ